MVNQVLKDRIEFASRYHRQLAKHLHSSWFDVYEEVLNSNDFGIAEALVLLHPHWYQEIGVNLISDPRGPNSFSGLKQNARCRSYELWGYECPYLESEIHIDHTFPFSRGGVTQAENAMYLCREHNLSKSTDLHMIPWEDFRGKNWIKSSLEISIKSAQTRTKNVLYPIDSVLKRN
jgi:hypothetical protein